MLDRASTFSDPTIVELLKTKFIPVAIDQAYQRRQEDAEGEFYRKIALQGPRHDFEGSTTQGFYAATSSGKFLFYNNYRGPGGEEGLIGELNEALSAAAAGTESVAPIADGERDRRYAPQPPEGGLFLRAHSKVLHGYDPPKDRFQKIFQEGLGRDNFWITGAEHEALVRGELPDSLKLRLVRYHFVDNTRGEPPMWERGEVRALSMTLKNGELRGSVSLSTDDGKRSYDAEMLGYVETDGKRVTRMDLVVRGLFEGRGEYTKGPPPGKFPLAISFTIADGSDTADAIPPQGSRGWVEGYFE